MKKNIYMMVLAVVTLVIAMTAVAMAGTTTTSVAASGTVTNICVVAGSPAVAFGNIDALTNAAGATATTTHPTLWCTKNDSVTVGDDGGLWNSGTSKRLKSAAGDYINYTLGYSAALTGQGKNTNIGGAGVGNLDITASIAGGGLDNAPAGVYSDTVVLTITY